MAQISQCESDPPANPPPGIPSRPELISESPASRFFSRDSRFWIVVFLAALAFLAGAFARTITTPWVEEDTWYGAVYSQAAHNSLRAGFFANAGVPATLYFGPLPIPRAALYVHHPTLLPWQVTASFALFGEAEWSARLVPILCSLASVVFLWLLLRGAIGLRAAALGAAIFATLPMELHYGDMVDFEPCLVLWMLAALWSLRHWHATGLARWAAVSAVCCQLALWTDWPGYLFVLVLFAGHLLLWRKPSLAGFRLPGRAAGRFALLLLGLVGFSGMLFLVQIRLANPEAWSGLWTALLMRVSNHVAVAAGAETLPAPTFTLREWVPTVLRGMSHDYLAFPWLLALAGLFFLRRRSEASEGWRWCGWAALPMAVAGVLYVVILPNESFIHDFTTFYLIGPLAIIAALGFDGCIEALEGGLRYTRLRALLGPGVCALLLGLAVKGFHQAEAQRSQFCVLDGETPEPADLAPVLGRSLGRAFPPGTEILCNFDPYGSTMNYYAQRTILTSLDEPDEWQAVIAREQLPLGGIIWLDAPDASKIAASLPKAEVSPVKIDGLRFALWRSTRAQK